MVLREAGGFFVLIVAFFLLLIGGIGLRLELDRADLLRRATISTKGLIVVTSSSSNKIRFETIEKKTIEAWAAEDVFDNQLPDGEIMVRYDPNNPKDAITPPFKTDFIVPVLIVSIGAGCFILGIWCFSHILFSAELAGGFLRKNYKSIGINLLPLLGVMLLGWDIAEIFFIYWLESAIVVIGTILRMFIVRDRETTLSNYLFRIPRIIFLSLHSLLFSFGLLFFVCVTAIMVRKLPYKQEEILSVFLPMLASVWPVVIPFFVEQIKLVAREIKQKTKECDLYGMSFLPYARLLTLFFAVMVGWALAGIFKNMVFIMLVLVFLKIIGEIFIFSKREQAK